MSVLLNFINGVNLGIEWFDNPEDNEAGWIIDLLIIRLIIFTRED